MVYDIDEIEGNEPKASQDEIKANMRQKLRLGNQNRTGFKKK